MKKADRLQALVQEYADNLGGDPHYLGYFECFNAERYYEAHDILEQLWLRTKDSNHLFYKALIQVAGAFVHLQKQFLRPNHPKDRCRLAPAERLLKLAARNLEQYEPIHLGLNVSELKQACLNLAASLAETGRNPWAPSKGLLKIRIKN